jgi:hypothetical protein
VVAVAAGRLAARRRLFKNLDQVADMRERVQTVVFAYESGLVRPGDA